MQRWRVNPEVISLQETSIIEKNNEKYQLKQLLMPTSSGKAA
jgi:hypothetical protein